MAKVLPAMPYDTPIPIGGAPPMPPPGESWRGIGYDGRVVRRTVVWPLAVLGFGLVSAAAYARRGPVVSTRDAPPTVATEAPHFEGDEDRALAWGPVLELAEAERGVPFARLPALRIV